MENNEKNKKEVKIDELCVDCKELIGKGRYTPPHKNLVQTNFKEVKSQFGNVDEYYYKCNACPKTWLHETGSYGEGWI